MKYYFVGIKGSGMSALAVILKQQNNEVFGSDLDTVYFTDKNLSENNIIVESFDSEIKVGIDELILGNAFDKNHFQVIDALAKNIKVTRYIDYVSNMSIKYESIAIAGTNGKTTTTGLLNSMLKDEKKICLIGDGTGYADSDAKKFIFEACEYKGHFTNYFPDYAIVNNIEMDHPDFFTSLDHVIEIFQEFASNSKILVVNGDDQNCLQLKHDEKYTFGFEKGNDLMCYDLKETQQGYFFKLNYKNQLIGEYELAFTGMHMMYNSLSCILVGLLMGKKIDNIISNINQFKGVKRRFEVTVINKEKNIVLIDDYAHHPTAIDLTINAIRQRYPNSHLTVLFQPHTYSRTIEFLDEFARSLKNADELFLLEIFGSVREANSDIDISLLKNKIDKNVHENIEFIKDIKKDSVIALLGAGDIDKLYKDKIISMLGE